MTNNSNISRLFRNVHVLNNVNNMQVITLSKCEKSKKPANNPQVD